jgi:hypothetical protein
MTARLGDAAAGAVAGGDATEGGRARVCGRSSAPQFALRQHLVPWTSLLPLPRRRRCVQTRRRRMLMVAHARRRAAGRRERRRRRSPRSSPETSTLRSGQAYNFFVGGACRRGAGACSWSLTHAGAPQDVESDGGDAVREALLKPAPRAVDKPATSSSEVREDVAQAHADGRSRTRARRRTSRATAATPLLFPTS